MIIGFSQRRQTVPETSGPLEQVVILPVDVRSMIVSEIDYNVTFEAPISNVERSADVGEIDAVNLLNHDALFGTINEPFGDLQDSRKLSNSSNILSSPLTITIINDIKPECEECFTISIASPDVAGDRDIYECFDDDDNMDMFFCLHEICIAVDENDGLFVDSCLCECV